jgi:hypothetical protein
MAVTLYWIVQADAVATPTGAQIVAGQDGTGAAALASGSEAYTAAGDYSEAVAITGLSANTAYEQAWVAYDGSTYSTPVTATITTPANVSNALTGQAVTISAGTMVAALAQALTGSNATVSAGTLAQALTQPLVGSAATASAGTLVSAVTQPLTGSAVTASAGTLTANVGTGDEAALTGSASTSSAGTLVSALTQPLTGASATVSAGTLVSAVAQPLTGSAVTASAGTLTAAVDQNVTVALTGETVSVIAGDVSTLGGVAVSNKGAGKPTRLRKRRQVVQIDGEDFIVESEDEAIALLDKAKEQAEQLATLAQSRANKAERRPARRIMRDARRQLAVPEITVEPEVAEYADKILAQIRDLYQSTIQDIEISAMLHRIENNEQDDEDILLLMA